MAREILQLIVVSVIFLLSLGGACVLFRWFQATAVIKGLKHQAGGALAGFLLIFGALDLSYYKFISAAPDGDHGWTIVGEVRLDGRPDHGTVEVSVVPPMPRDLSRPNGEFRLRDVEVGEDGWPELQISMPGYNQATGFVVDDWAADIDHKHKRIRLAGPIVLTPEPADGEVSEGSFFPET